MLGCLSRRFPAGFLRAQRAHLPSYFSLRSAHGKAETLMTKSLIFSDHPYDYNAVLANQLKKIRWKNFQYRFGVNRGGAAHKKSIIVLGTGWGSMNFIRNLDVSYYDVTVVSPRNFFTFTPLLPAVSAGTLSPRACLEPVRPKLMRGKQRVMNFFEGWAIALDPNKSEVMCHAKTGERFTLPYDYLVMAVGAEVNTFGTPGVYEHALFLKEVEHAREIRRRVLNNFEQAILPGISDETKSRLLHFVFIGGGPTGVETAAEIADFIREDASIHYPDVARFAKISLIEMLPRVLPPFSEEVSTYTAQNLQKMGVQVLTQTRVLKVTHTSVVVEDTTKKTPQKELPCGLVLWASGVGQVPFAKTLLQTLPEQKDNRVIRVDENLRVHGGKSLIYGLGDCTIFSPEPLSKHSAELYEIARKAGGGFGAGIAWLTQEKDRLGTRFPQVHTAGTILQPSSAKEPGETTAPSGRNRLSQEEFTKLLQEIDASFRPPPPTAQNANQEARYLASVFNQYRTQQEKDRASAYIYQWKGSMAYVGKGQSVLQFPTKVYLGGALSNLIWKTFYLSQQMSKTNKFLCLLDWYRTRFFGRDTGRDHTLDGTPLPPSSASSDGGSGGQ